jgi:hypothetical protein
MRVTPFVLLVVAAIGLGACGNGNDGSSNSTPSRPAQRVRNPSPSEVKRQIKAYKRREDPRLELSVRSWLRMRLTGAGGNKSWYAAIRDVSVRHGRVTITIATPRSANRPASREICDVLATSEIEGIASARVLHSPGRRVLKTC